MNKWIITGQLAEDARIVDGKTRFLSARVAMKERGFGERSSQVFTKYVEVIMFGRDIDAAIRGLVAGAWVEAEGKAEIDTYKPEKPKLKCVGRIGVIDPEMGDNGSRPRETSDTYVPPPKELDNPPPRRAPAPAKTPTAPPPPEPEQPPGDGNQFAF